MNVDFTWSYVCSKTIYVLGNNILINIIELKDDAWSCSNIKVVLDLLKPENKWRKSSSVKGASIKSFNLDILPSVLSGHL